MNPNSQQVFNNQFNISGPNQSLVTIPQVIQQVTQGAIDGLIAALPDYFSDRVLGLDQLNP